jgi:hypothetical protein
MSETTCLGCLERDAVIATLLSRVQDLEQRVRELEGPLGQNASNSSIPPSTNPPQASNPVDRGGDGGDRPSDGGWEAPPGHRSYRSHWSDAPALSTAFRKSLGSQVGTAL